MRKQHKAVLRGRQFEIVLAEAESSLRQHISKIHARAFMKNLRKTGCKPEATVL
jgi:hypothetical protein